MRISDWSSDVCSSDLRHGLRRIAVDPQQRPPAIGTPPNRGVDHVGQTHVAREAGGPVDLGRKVEAGQRPSGQSVLETAADGEMFGQLQRGCLLGQRSEEHTSELQSLMRISYAVFCLKKKKLH